MQVGDVGVGVFRCGSDDVDCSPLAMVWMTTLLPCLKMKTNVVVLTMGLFGAACCVVVCSFVCWLYRSFAGMPLALLTSLVVFIVLGIGFDVSMVDLCRFCCF